VPPAHVFEHDDQALKSETLQSTGQGEELHVRVSRRVAQYLPPATGATSTLRSRACVPLPHVRVQSVQSLKSESSQSIGQL
jgi:hypothetical protein